MRASPMVVITDSDLASSDDELVLREAGLRTERLQARTEADLIAALTRLNPDALIVQWAPVSGAVLDAAPRCRLISRLGIGYDMIDVAAATERGVAVANTPDYCVDEVVAHTLAMSLWLLRGLGRYDTAVRRGEWSAAAPYPAACRPSESIIGVIGLGRIGSRVASQARALGFGVLAADPYATAPAGVELTGLEDLLRRSDLVTLHAPLTDQTRLLIRGETLGLMRPGALLVNTCRGGLVDEAAVAAAIRSGRLAGAALDVFAVEPLPAASPLRSLPNVLLTPHAAWYSPASLAQLPVQAARQVVDFLAGRPVGSIINPQYAAAARLAAPDGAAPAARLIAPPGRDKQVPVRCTSG
jgi:D-3-phosphoglycerate dehydrogenase / 2-oxoglutarate reductase